MEKSHEKIKSCLDKLHIDAVILCGGLGTRLRKEVRDRQKCMAEVVNRPFLDFIIEYLQRCGVERVILCVGYMAEMVKKYYQERVKGCEILFSEEKEPLGTGGAVRNAKFLIQTDPFLVMNGDSFCPVNLHDFINSHIKKQALASVVAAKADKSSDYGSIIMRRTNRIIDFAEKVKIEKKTNFINAGIYLFNKDIFTFMPNRHKFSLEYDLFPAIVDKKFYGYKTKMSFIDIGIPKSYQKARKLLTSSFET